MKPKGRVSDPWDAGDNPGPGWVVVTNQPGHRIIVFVGDPN
jgi:hypothetical protein